MRKKAKPLKDENIAGPLDKDLTISCIVVITGVVRIMELNEIWLRLHTPEYASGDADLFPALSHEEMSEKSYTKLCQFFELHRDLGSPLIVRAREGKQTSLEFPEGEWIILPPLEELT